MMKPLRAAADSAVKADSAKRAAVAVEPAPLIIEVKRNALDDGPGIRTTIFFKGCPLSCVWCHNPETTDPRAEVMQSPVECIGCGHCAEVCPNGAVSFGPPPVIDRSLCRRCGTCAAGCPAAGVRLIGRPYAVEELVELVALDLPFYRNSGGGVTLSGGEATMFPRFAGRLLEGLKTRGVHTLLETCGHYGGAAFRRHILPNLDLIYFDLKLADREAHRRYTGRYNDLILRNLAELVAGGHADLVLPRIPLIPGITDTPENLAGLAAILRRLGFSRVALLPYNPTWLKKAAGLGRDRGYAHVEFMSAEEEERCRRTFAGFEVVG